LLNLSSLLSCACAEAVARWVASARAASVPAAREAILCMETSWMSNDDRTEWYEMVELVKLAQWRRSAPD